MSKAAAKDGVSRREFLRTSAAGFAAGLGLTSNSLAAQTAEGLPYTDIVRKHMTDGWVDQYKQKFDLNSLAGKPYIALFGYNGCQFCDKIGRNVAKLRAEGNANVQKVPIVIFNVTPEDDLQNRAEYVGHYYKVGVCQTPEQAKEFRALSDEERETHVPIAYKADEAIPQNRRLFHIVFPEKKEQVQALETDVNIIRNRSDKTAHGLHMALVDGNGKCIVSRFAATDDPQKCNELVADITAAIESLPAPGRGVDGK